MCIPPAGFEPSIPTSERPKTYALNRAAAGFGHHLDLFISLSYQISHEALEEGKSWGEVKKLASNSIRWRRFVDALCP